MSKENLKNQYAFYSSIGRTKTAVRKYFGLRFLLLVVVIAVGAVGMTGAFFSDTETSTGNTFTAGAIDLKVDNTQHFNNTVCVAGHWQLADDEQESVPQYPVIGSECGGSWTAKDLGAGIDKFFNFTDIKPGDHGEDTVSLHVENNDAWVCADVSNLVSDDNGLTGPESKVDQTDGPGNGELINAMDWKVWMDDGAGSGYDKCDNVWEDGEQVLAEGHPTNGALALFDSTTGNGPLQGGSDTCLGVSWSLPANSGNETQTDTMTGDISFSVEQSRNNDNFVCSGEQEHGWIEKTPNATFEARLGHVSFVKDGKVWILGGFGSSAILNDIWSSGANDGTTWTETSPSGPLWTPRAAMSGLVYNGKMWIMGGFDSSFDSLNDVWSSPDGVTWTEETSNAGWSLRHGASAIVFGGKMWIMGGGTPNSSFTTLNDVWSSTDGATWTHETDAPWTARRYSTLVNFQGKMFLIGGLDASNGGLNDVWSSSNGINWNQETASAPWTGRGGHQVVVFQNKLWLMGGEIPHYPAVNTVHFNDVWSSPDGVNWTQEPDAPWAARELFTSVVSGSGIWVMAGGVNLPVFSDVWKFVN